MRRVQKEQVEGFLKLLGQVHEEIKKYIENKKNIVVQDLLLQCQEGAIELGKLIEKTEGECSAVIPLLEDYCEVVYQIYERLTWEQNVNAHKSYKKLRNSLIQIKNSIRNNIKVHYEIVFFPYKASMWDSLESVWQAAEADPDCDVYVVPIPYYDRNPDGSLGTYHYEGHELPPYVPVTHYETYCIEDRIPDIAYIHNPYDHTNYVTSIDPRFYSYELKKNVGCLIYIPYYATSGGMADGQMQCMAYYYVDYIIIQSERYRRFFDPALPDEKFLPLGSPKFDRIIHMCENPPQPPAEWKEKMEGKRVFFYNTSINGMLANTKIFLNKMKYVFECFKGRDDVCLIWRPHPLLASTFNSMRPMYKASFDILKTAYIDEEIGIYDDTPDIEKTIACSDAYIGDVGTSVTSLFGVVGKPLFILNNSICTLPEEDDWKGEKINLQINEWGDGRYYVSRNNQLWFSEYNDFHYKFYMDLDLAYSGGGYYIGATEIKGRIYVFPANAQHMLIINNKKIRKIEFKEPIVQSGAFLGYWCNEKYAFLFPHKYPYLIRFEIDTEEICYVEGINQFNIRTVEGEEFIGGIALYGNEWVFASPVNNQFLFMDIDTFKVRSLTSNSKSNLGIEGIVVEGDNLWLMPLNGMILTCWNPKTGDIREYGNVPKEFKSIKWPLGYECYERPFGMIVFSKKNEEENIIISPHLGNMYLSLNRETGEMKEWRMPLEFHGSGRNGYFTAGGMGGFVITHPQSGKADCRIWYAPERKLYDINIDTKEYKEVEIEFDYDEVKEHEPGFMEESEWMQYCLNENAFNSLKDFLDGKITGRPFDRDRQIKAFSKINADTIGTCGRNVHQFVKGKIT